MAAILQTSVAPRADIETAQRIRLAFCLFATAIIAAKLFASAESLLQDPDNWWHVRVGLDMLSNLTFPTVDTYSHTFAGHPWIAKEWLGQILLALAYTAGGWDGVALLTIAAISLTLFLLAWHLSAEFRPILAVGLTFLLAVLVSPTFNARPFIFTFPIIVVWTARLFRAAREVQAPPLWLLPLLCLWANLHATFTLGFVIAFFAGLDVLERSRLSNPRLLAKWIAFGLLCPLVTLLNPYGFKAILATFTVAQGNEAVAYIGEWQPFNASVDYLQGMALLLAIFGLLVSRLRIGLAQAAFLVFTLHLFLIHSRFMYLLILLVPVMLAVEIAGQYPQISARKWAAERRDGLERFLAARFHLVSGGIAASLIFAAAMYIAVPHIAPSPTTSAKDALAFVEENKLSGNVLNSYNFGGTLIFHGIKTFIDGRTDQLFLNGFMERDQETGDSAGRPLLEEQVKMHAIDWALLEADDKRIPFFNEMTGWRRAYADEYAVIYTRND